MTTQTTFKRRTGGAMGKKDRPDSQTGGRSVVFQLTSGLSVIREELEGAESQDFFRYADLSLRKSVSLSASLEAQSLLPLNDCWIKSPYYNLALLAGC